MIIKWTTCKEVFARIIRNTRLTDETFLADIPEWVGEAVYKLKTRGQYELKKKVLPVNFFSANLPCSADALAAVIFNGQRILPSKSDGPLSGSQGKIGVYDKYDNVFSSMPSHATPNHLSETSINNWPEYVKSSSLIDSYAPCPSVRYRVNYNKLEIGVECGNVLVYYWSVPQDEDGFPMIPDNENYKTAIYWYVRSMLIGAGYPDRVFSFEECHRKWNEYFGIATNEITYPTVDEVEESLILANRIADLGTGWRDFFVHEPEGTFYGKGE